MLLYPGVNRKENDVKSFLYKDTIWKKENLALGLD